MAQVSLGVQLTGFEEAAAKIQGVDAKLQALGKNPHMERLASTTRMSATEINRLDIELTQLRSRLDPTFAAVRRLEMGQDTLNRALREGMLNSQQYSAALGKLQAEYRSTTSANDNLFSGFTRLQGVIAGVRSAFFLLAGAGGVGLVARSLFEAGTQLQRFDVSFAAATGSVKEGIEELGFVKRLSSDLGVSFLSTASAYQKFSAAVQGTSLAGEQAQKIFTAFSGASRVLGHSADDTRLVFLALEQMVSKGKVSTEELRRQLGERLPGAFRLAAEAMGVTTAKLDEMLRAGEITADEFLPKLAAKVQEVYGESVPKAAKMAQAELERLRNEWLLMEGAFANNSGFMDVAAGSIRNLTNHIKSAGNVINEELPTFERLLNTLSMLPGFTGRMFGAAAMLSESNRITAGRLSEQSVIDSEISRLNSKFGTDTTHLDIQRMASATPMFGFDMGGIDKKGKLTGAAAEFDKVLKMQQKAQEKANAEAVKAAKDRADRVSRDAIAAARALGDDIHAFDENEFRKRNFAVASAEMRRAEIVKQNRLQSEIDLAVAHGRITEDMHAFDEKMFKQQTFTISQENIRRLQLLQDQVKGAFADSMAGEIGALLKGDESSIRSAISGFTSKVKDALIDIFARRIADAIVKPFEGAIDQVVGIFSTGWQSIFDKSKPIFESIWGFITKGFEAVVGKMAATDWSPAFGGLSSTLVTALAPIYGVFDAIKNPQAFLGSFATTGMSGFGGIPIVGDIFGGIGGAIGDVFDSFGFATGTDMMVSKPTVFVAGEKGVEQVTVSPVGAAHRRGDGGLTINVNGPMIGDYYNTQKFLRDLERWSTRG